MKRSPKLTAAQKAASQRKLTQYLDSVPQHLRDYANWTQYDKSKVPTQWRTRYEELCVTAILVLKAQPVEQILEASPVGERRLYQLMYKAISPRRGATTAHGTRAFVYGLDQNQRTRVAEENTQAGGRGGYCGLWGKFWREYPAVGEQLEAFLNGAPGLDRPNRVTPHVLWTQFKTIVVRVGVPETAYPRNTTSHGKRPLVAWWKNDYQPRHHIAHITNEHGHAAGTAAAFEMGDGTSRTPPEPYTVWVIDECQVDLDATIKVPAARWEEEWVFLRKLPLLRCRCIGAATLNISWQISLRAQASGDDIIQLLKRAVLGQPAVDSVSDSMQYVPGAGYPQNLFERLRYALPSVLYLDNALSHLFNALQYLVQRLWGGVVILGRPGTPKARPDIESSMAGLSALLHQLPNTSGTGPKDPVKERSVTSPDRAVSVHLLEQVIDVYMANQNALPSAGAGHLEPLVRLERLLEAGRVRPSYLPEGKRLPHHFCEPVRVTVRGDLRKGRLPHVNYDYVRYSSDWLKRNFQAMCKEFWALADYSDLRTIVLVDDDGSEFTKLRAQGFWGVVAHDRRMKAIYAKHRAQAEFKPRPYEVPLFGVLEHLRERAPQSRDDALDLAYMDRYLRQHHLAGLALDAAAQGATEPMRTDLTTSLPERSASPPIPPRKSPMEAPEQSTGNVVPIARHSFKVPRRIA